MAIERSDTGSISVGVEDLGFGDGASSYQRLLQAKALPDRSNLKQMYHESDRLRSGNQQEPGVLGHLSDSGLSLEMFTRGYTASTPTNFPTLGADLLDGSGSELPDIVLLAAALGQIHVSGAGGALDAVQAAPAPTADTFSVVDGTLYAVGQPIAIEISSGSYETRRIKSIATNAITVEFPFSGAPTALKTVYAGITIFPTSQPQLDSISMKIQGEDNDGGSYWQHTLLGMCANALGMSWDAQGFIETNIDHDVASWNRNDATAAPLYAADDGPERVPLIGAKFDYAISGGPTVKSFDAGAMEFDAGLTMLRPKSATATQGVRKSRFGINNPVLTVDPYKELEADWMTAAAPFRAQDQVSCVFQGGNTPGSIVALCVSNGQITDEPVLGDRDGLLVNPLQITPMVYTGDGTPGTDERNNTTPVGAPWCISFI